MLSDSLTVAHSLVSAARGEHSARCQASTPLQPHVDLLLRAIVSALDGSCTEAKEAWRGLSGAPPQSDLALDGLCSLVRQSVLRVQHEVVQPAAKPASLAAPASSLTCLACRMVHVPSVSHSFVCLLDILCCSRPHTRSLNLVARPHAGTTPWQRRCGSVQRSRNSTA